MYVIRMTVADPDLAVINTKGKDTCFNFKCSTCEVLSIIYLQLNLALLRAFK